MSTDATTPDARPAARYGGARRPLDRSNRLTGRAVILAVLVVAALTVVFFARFLMQREDVDVSATMGDFERVDDATFSMEIDVSRDDPDKAAYCIVRAIDYDKAEVGRRDVVVPAGGPRVQRIAVKIPTRDTAVSGGVYGCSSSLPGFLDDATPLQAADQARG